MTGLYVHGHVAHMAGAGIFPNSPGQLKSIFFQQTMHPLSSLLIQSTPACCFSSALCCWPTSASSRSDFYDYINVRSETISKCNKCEVSDPWQLQISTIYGHVFRNILHFKRAAVSISWANFSVCKLNRFWLLRMIMDVSGSWNTVMGTYLILILSVTLPN